MPEVTRVSWFQRLTKSVGGVILGIGLFFGSFVVLFLNEATIDKSSVAKTAVDVDAEKAPPANASGLVAIFGTVDTDKPIGDGLFLKPGKYLTVGRTAEVYAWVESKQTRTEKDPIGGGETTITTYSYRKDWVDQAQSETEFEGFRKQDYLDAQRTSGEIISNVKALRRTVADGFVKAPLARMGKYTIDTTSVELPAGRSVNLTEAVDKAKVGARGGVIEGDYVYLRKVRGAGAPLVGDERVSYRALPSGFKGTAFGKLNGASLEAFPIEETLKASTSLFRIFASDKQAAVQTLHSEYVLWTWIVRVIGFLMMWFGLRLVFDPLSTVLDLVRILGQVSRVLINIVLFLIALVLSAATVIVSLVIHNVVALVIVLAVLAALVALIIVLRKRKKPAAPTQQPA